MTYRMFGLVLLVALLSVSVTGQTPWQPPRTQELKLVSSGDTGCVLAVLGLPTLPDQLDFNYLQQE